MTAQSVALNGVCARMTVADRCVPSQPCMRRRVVVAAALQSSKSGRRSSFNHSPWYAVTSEEVLTDVGAVSLEGLVVAVKCFVHQVNKASSFVGKAVDPIRGPKSP